MKLVLPAACFCGHSPIRSVARFDVDSPEHEIDCVMSHAECLHILRESTGDMDKPGRADRILQRFSWRNLGLGYLGASLRIYVLGGPDKAGMSMLAAKVIPATF